jgi:hypothetical protein
MPSFIHLYRVDRARDRDERGPEAVDAAGCAWIDARGDRQAPRGVLTPTTLTRLEQPCAICGQADGPTTVYGHPSVVLIAGRPSPPPPTVAFCDRCVEEYRLGPGVSLAEDLINAWRTARGLAERDFSGP